MAAARDFQLLLNESLLPHVVSMPPVARRRFREKLGFLGAGLWDSGVKVKKLKGLSSKVVFEARLSLGERLLFTLGRDGDRALVYIWSLVQHDDISQGARRTGGENAPFLRFDPQESEEREELALSDLSQEYFTQEPLEAKVREDYGPQKWLVLDEAEWERLLRASEPDDLRLHLYLTREQERILEREPPILLSGTAGSGKTTVCVYYLLRPEYRGTKRLFVTYTSSLQRFSERIYRGLTMHTELELSRDPPELMVYRDLVTRLLGEKGDAPVVGLREFERIYQSHALAKSYEAELVWEEIRSIIKGAKPALSLQRYLTLADAYLGGSISARELEELKGMLLDLRRLELSRAIDGMVGDYEAMVAGMSGRGEGELERRVLKEVGGLLEKRSSRLAGPLLSYAEYAELGAKRAPNFRYDRKAIYAVAEYYQGKLEEGGKEDDIDRVRRAHERIARGLERASYDLVVCDEVQDLCDLEVSLLLRLARDPRAVVLAGDVKQTINPSGFRWEEVRRGFYERGLPVPELCHLSLNFRCVGNIVRLANGLLTLKQRLVGLASSEAREDWRFNGNPPLFLQGAAELDVLRAFDLHAAGRIVIVRTPPERDRIKSALGSELVFTIYEAKGLEFDSVLLWRLSSGPEVASLWRQIHSQGSPEGAPIGRLRHELNLLYVGVTRARNLLVVYEDAVAVPVWDLAELHGLVHRSSEPGEIELASSRASTPEEWERQAEYFLERQYWKAAEECFRNAGKPARAEEARARGCRSEGMHAEAAEHFRRAGLEEEAAESFEAGLELESAMAIWKTLGRGERFRLCRVKLYERRGEHARAADEWEKLGNLEGALRNWELGGMWERVGRYWSEWKQHRRAAEAFVRAGMLAEAAESLQRGKEYAPAAALYERARNWRAAAAIYRRLGDEEKLLECLLRIPDPRAAAAIFELRGEPDRAIQQLRRFAAQGSEAVEELERELRELMGRQGPKRARAAALRASALRRHAEAAALLEEAGEPGRAFHEWESAGDAAGMARCMAAEGRYPEAARLLEAREPELTGPIGEYLEASLGPPGEARGARLAALAEEADRLERSGALEAALSRYRLLEDEDKLLELYSRLRRDSEAVAYFLARGRPSTALALLERRAPPGLDPALVAASVRALEVKLLDPDQEGREAGSLGSAAELLVRFPDDESCRDAGRSLLDALCEHIDAESELPIPLETLMIQLRHTSSIQSALLGPARTAGAGNPARGSFLRELRVAAEATSDPALLASWASVCDRLLFSQLLLELELTDRTVSLFEAGETEHARAVEHHLARGHWERAVRLHLRWNEHAEAAALHEQHGSFLGAARLYRRAGEFSRALECARRAGDEAEMARAHEGLGELQRAIDIWSSLGRRLDVERLRREL